MERKNGWKLQQHKLSGHYGILDSEDVRQAWDSSYSVIIYEFRKFTGEVSL